MQVGHRGLIEQEYHHREGLYTQYTPQYWGGDTKYFLMSWHRSSQEEYHNVHEGETKYFSDTDSLPAQPHKYFDLSALWGTARSMRFSLGDILYAVQRIFCGILSYPAPSSQVLKPTPWIWKSHKLDNRHLVFYCCQRFRKYKTKTIQMLGNRG